MKSVSKTASMINELYGVSRYILHRYRKHGIIHEVGRNKYGHLLFDELAESRIVLARFLQSLDFEIREIAVLLKEDEETVISVLRQRVIELEQKRKDLDVTIREAKALISDIESGSFVINGGKHD